jgi:hypothetical protein
MTFVVNSGCDGVGTVLHGSRGTLLADSPLAPGPTRTSKAGCISPVEMPFKYNHGIAASRLAVFRTYGSTNAE